MEGAVDGFEALRADEDGVGLGEAVETSAGGMPARWVIHAATMEMDFRTDAQIIEKAGLLYIADTRGFILSLDPATRATAVLNGDPNIGSPRGFAMDDSGAYYVGVLSTSGNYNIERALDVTGP